ncbi:Cytochrome P450 monooxygenase afvE [Trichoderma lentiforme]|uniref:Cytochrome P450 monooxygenase afvE n=1 Tax=Trichoderma lentiforme TaxID=1567552 RepID=A0A9P4XKU5_9HYPO|nr:Cytochrome P450 monooxygenase afvE [Trichoderma lentiforme]
MAGTDGGVRQRGKPPKYRTSCDNCQTAKVKCGHEKPSCRRCSVHRVDCVYSLSRRMGRPRAKKVVADESPRRLPTSTEPNETEIPKPATPDTEIEDAEFATHLAEPPAGEAEPNNPSASAAGQIPDPWAPLLGDLGQLNETEAINRLNQTPQLENDSVDFLSTESPMELLEITAFDRMPSFLDDMPSTLQPQASASAIPMELFDPHDMLSVALPAMNAKSDVNDSLSMQQPGSSLVREPCMCQHSSTSSGNNSMLIPGNNDQPNELLHYSSTSFQDASCSPREETSESPSNTSQPSDSSSSLQASRESSSELSWRTTQVTLIQTQCDCMETISKRIASLKLEQQSSSFMPIDCVLMLEKEVEESLVHLHKCKNCRLDSILHLLALISVRMMLDILQKTARSEFVSRPKSAPDSSNDDIVLCIESVLETFTMWKNDLLSMETTILRYILQRAVESPVAATAVVVASSILLILFFDWLNYQKQRKRLGNIPVVGDAPYLWKRLRWTENESNLNGVLQRGYDTFSKKLKPWAYWGQHDDFILVLPPGACDEVKNADISQMSFLQAVEDSYHFKLHTNILGRAHVDAVRQSVNKNMNSLHDSVVLQSDESIPKVFDSLAKSILTTHLWKKKENHLANKALDQEPFAGFLEIWHLVHTVAASFLIGPRFADNPEYMSYIEDYCLNVPGFVHQYFWVPAPLRKMFWHLSPAGFKVRKVLKRLKFFIIPEIKRTIEIWRTIGRSDAEYTLLGAMLDLKEERGMIKRDPTAMSSEEEERQVDIFSDEVIFTAFDSAGPVVCLVTQLLYESIRDEKLTEALRAEIFTALANNNGEWSVQMMSSLPRLESFTRETLRVNGPTLFSVTRSVLKPFQLKSGLTLRPGNIITSPSWMIHRDEDNYPKAHEFDPYRFYDEATNSATTKATTASNTFLAYGYGSQMCPGRYLGVRMTQIIFAKLLMRYDALFEGDKRAKPDNIVMPGQVLPSYYAKIVLKLRNEAKTHE